MSRIVVFQVGLLLIGLAAQDVNASEPAESDTRFPIIKLKSELSELATIIRHLGACPVTQLALENKMKMR